MRLRLTDDSWTWLRVDGFAYPQLRVTDESYQVFRTVGESWALHRVADLRTRYVISLESADGVFVADLVPTYFTFAWKPDSVYSSDYQRFEFSAGIKEVVSAADFTAWTFQGNLASSSAAVDAISVVFQSGLFDDSFAVDRVTSAFTVLLRDSVNVGSVFVLGGDWFVETSENVLASDAFYSTLVDPSGDVVGATDTVIIGVRLVIDFYFGGLAFGGGPFGGRIV